jgi:hypothetical protein
MLLGENIGNQSNQPLIRSLATHKSAGGAGHAITRVRTWLDLGLTLGLYASMIWFLRPLSYGDTVFYVREILAADRGLQLADWRILLEFGHLLWRPLAWFILRIIRYVNPVAAMDERTLVLTILVSMSVLSGVIATVLLQRILRQLGFGRAVCFIVCTIFVYCNATVYSASTGVSYMLALAFSMAALWLAVGRGPEDDDASRTKLWLSGAFLSLSVASWFPFVLIVPALAFAPVIGFDDSHRPSARLLFRKACHLIGASLAGGIALFGAAIVALRFDTLSQIKEWIAGSSHGWRQTSNLLRLGMGLPRCCVALTDEAGIPWKRFLFRDPFASVHLRDLLQPSLIWMIAFYFGTGLLLYTLFRTHRGRSFLWLLLFAALPVLAFAIFVFEPSSIERFMPLFPFYFVALGYQIHYSWPNLVWRTFALIYPLMLTTSIVGTYYKGNVERHWAPTRERLHMLQQQLPAKSTVMLFTNWDDLFMYAKDNPREAVFSESFAFWVVLRPANDRIFCWRQLFASRALEAWRTPGDVWISERVLASAPIPEWGWVEGDDRAVHWREVPEFFHQVQFDKKVGDSDGFVRIARTPANQAMFNDLVAQPCKPITIPAQLFEPFR